MIGRKEGKEEGRVKMIGWKEGKEDGRVRVEGNDRTEGGEGGGESESGRRRGESESVKEDGRVRMEGIGKGWVEGDLDGWSREMEGQRSIGRGKRGGEYG
ncbi:hypothetical protein Pcinc_043438 [Petrolisthes cinctipes]|uniref:Uncharacterized protein n=1 Tax=Petrolisthes cinctipes TaxID=88211 RepID=A0AAE1BFX7_PETCI|nr:hypothetical protein Pcinc_043438 [Petrolisthes cinctipes]